MILLIAGSRDVDEKEAENIIRCFGKQNSDKEYSKIISGGAKGVDTLARELAKDYGFPFQEYPADWSLGKQAGYIRNKAMGEVADEALIIWNGESKGARHMINIMLDLGKPVTVKICPCEPVDYNDFEDLFG